jgi:C4-dicarboxylate-specific signal transduction histidine kinase
MAAALTLVLPIDCLRLDQVATNIFENSLSACHDPVGSRSLSETTLDGGQRCASVRDNGPGLSPDAAADFRSLLHHQDQGTGLGMAITSGSQAQRGRLAVVPVRAPEIVLILPRQATS